MILPHIRIHSELEKIVGVSPWTESVRTMIASVAAYPSNVTIIGPTGTGKGLIARAIHAVSPRAARKFISVNCTSITPPLFSSYLFGHLKGAYTGATYAALGCLRAAEGGTLLLDEIGDLDLELQAKLLNVLQDRTVTPVGSHEEIAIDVRFIAATNRELEEEVEARRFRKDLYFRLDVIEIRTAALRERPEDIEVLARHFLAKFAVRHGLPLKQLSAAALDRLHRYDWPGNVRELENVLERAAVFTPGDEIPADVIHLHSPARSMTPMADAVGTLRIPLQAPAAETASRWPTAAEAEWAHISKTLERVGHNLTAAAQLLDIDRNKLRRRIKKRQVAFGQSAAMRRAA